jgi:hypothetical protein
VSSSSIGRVVVTDVSWNRETVNVRRGDNLTLTCRLTLGDSLGGVLGGPAVFRVVHSHYDRTLLVSDNGNMATAFSRLGRYEVLYNPPLPETSGNYEERSAEIVVRIYGK